jgi:hypothetical protein
VLLFALEIVCGDEDGEVGISDLERLDLLVEPLLDVLPDGVRGCWRG